MKRPILRFAVPTPLRRLFDYLPPVASETPPVVGGRYTLPFGRKQIVGLLVEVGDSSALPLERLKPAIEQLDSSPLLPPSMMAVLSWAASYYHHPPGEVYLGALPTQLRQAKGTLGHARRIWTLTKSGLATDPTSLTRAPKQAQLLTILANACDGLDSATLNSQVNGWRAPMKRLVELELVSTELHRGMPESAKIEPTEGPQLNDQQQKATASIIAGLEGYQTTLLYGVTGSGKTEVYLKAIEATLAAGRQSLILVPEIGLTPQLLRRFSSRFTKPIALLHSALSDSERVNAWLAASRGEADIIIGTRSAIYTPMAHPGLIIIDEEHDSSFIQQDGFRYSARDVAVVRAREEQIPVVLGSATPSLESIANTRRGRYQLASLPKRAGPALQPSMQIVDMRNQPLQQGLSQPLLNAIEKHLQQGAQVLLYLNRRGYAPTLLCHSCGWLSRCHRCDAHTTLHAADKRLRCHHCGFEQQAPAHCPDCQGTELLPLGQGTERIEQSVREIFAEHPMVRIDRDTTRRKGSMESLLESVQSGASRILIGTQMLAKGHHFPRITLVAILDADQGLHSIDFRAAERMAQAITQVAGRAGRAEHPGEVLIQTHSPEHPLLQILVNEGYQQFADAALSERSATHLPPYGHLCLLRAEATQREATTTFLQAAADLARGHRVAGVSLFGPVAAPMERRAGRYRSQLLLQSTQRPPLHTLLRNWAGELEGLPEGRKVRWSLDVDPSEMY